MAKVYMMCGKICSGKSTHAAELRKLHKAVVLSVDEITLALFGQDAGDKLDDYVARAEKYLYEKSVEIIESGINVILDWGFWTKRERNEAREFYASKNVECEFYYIDIPDEEWYRRLDKRNKAVMENKTSAYYVDEGLAEKFKQLFEIPDRSEIDVWIN
ncbi:MAG: ATP-binding protein [Treponema sp.]|nr:ATP-binding protein [Treponema sp.]